MGEVNVLPVRVNGGGRVFSEPFGQDFASPAPPAGFSEGHLVVRPEFMRFIARPGEADNHLAGRIYNEYALGSRIQYQVRVGERVFIVERLRQQAGARAGEDVLIGWDARDSVLVRD
jgi:spermidine/putrescine transport system ATP-binding protein